MNTNGRENKIVISFFFKKKWNHDDPTGLLKRRPKEKEEKQPNNAGKYACSSSMYIIKDLDLMARRH